MDRNHEGKSTRDKGSPNDTDQPRKSHEQEKNPSDKGDKRILRSRSRSCGGQKDTPQGNDSRPIEQKARDAVAREAKNRTKRPALRARRSNTLSVNEDEDSLFYLVFNDQSPVQTVLRTWIDSYKMNHDDAMLQLVQFFFNACGCKGKITVEQFTTMEYSDIILHMAKGFGEEGKDYPLAKPGLLTKTFHSQFCTFIQTLVSQCRNSIVYDHHLMDNITNLFVGLSDSPVRAFRHTASVAAMTLATALVDVALDLLKSIENIEHQYRKEKDKNTSQRCDTRLKNLKAQHKELEENIDEIKSMLTYIFKSLFVPRYKDLAPDIRLVCITEIGIWMTKFPSFFVNDYYLKYVGWSLFDKHADVRRACLQALQPLYDLEEYVEKLDLFTNKFKERFLSMTLDKDLDVSVKAIEILIALWRHDNEVLTDVDVEHIYKLVYSTHCQVAYAAGVFLNLNLREPETESTSTTKSGKKHHPNTPSLRDLVTFVVEGKFSEHVAYLVDSVIRSNKMLKDWECMTDLLLEEPGSQGEALDSKEETVLIDIMVCCIRQSATGQPPIGRDPTPQKNKSVKEIKQIRADKICLTDHFIAALPPLLVKFCVDKEKLVNLLSIPQYFDLERYVICRQEGNLDLLLDRIQEIASRITDMRVMETCAKTLELLCAEGATILTRCEVSQLTLLDKLVDHYKEAVADWIASMDEEVEPNDKEVEISLMKLSVFGDCHNLSRWNIWNSIFQHISDTINQDSDSGILSEEAVKHCLGICHMGILWDLRAIENKLDANTEVENEIEMLKQRLHEFVGVLKQVLDEVPGVPKLQKEAYLCLCDLLVIFDSKLGEKEGPHAALKQLVYKPGLPINVALDRFLQQYVFDNSEELGGQIPVEETVQRRTFLASFCKLVAYNVLRIEAATKNVFKYYVKYYREYGDIMTRTITEAQKLSNCVCASTMIQSLGLLFEEIPVSLRCSCDTEELKKLEEHAKQFAVLLASDDQRAIRTVHHDGIKFALNENTRYRTENPPPNVTFLKILMEFSCKLDNKNKKQVLRFLNHHVTQRGKTGGWEPLLLYRNSLSEKKENQRQSVIQTPSKSSKSKEPLTTPKLPHKPKLNIRVISVRKKRTKVAEPSFDIADLSLASESAASSTLLGVRGTSSGANTPARSMVNVVSNGNAISPVSLTGSSVASGNNAPIMLEELNQQIDTESDSDEDFLEAQLRALYN